MLFNWLYWNHWGQRLGQTLFLKKISKKKKLKKNILPVYKKDIFIQTCFKDTHKQNILTL